MKLYEVPRNTQIRLEDGTVLNFKHVDGAYSLCYTLEGLPCHIGASTEVEIIQKLKND